LLVDARQRTREVLDEPGERQLKGSAPADQHIVIPRPEPVRVAKPHDFPQPAPHPIALDRIADLARNGKSDPWRSGVGALVGLQHESLPGGPRPCRDAQKVRPFPQSFHGGAGRTLAAQALSRLRPRARRAFSTLRPPLVSMRLRNPWRRLRTSLLG
jgi:hypothetical protein